MTGKAFLYSLLDIDKEIRQKIEIVDELKANAIGTTASSDSERVQSSGSQDKLGGMVSKIVDLEKEIDDLADRYYERRKLAKELIFMINNERYQNVLYDLFILRNPLYQVADNNDMTYDACKSCRKRAIKVFDKLFEPYKSTFS